MNSRYHFVRRCFLAALLVVAPQSGLQADAPVAGKPLLPLSQRFAATDSNAGVSDVPDFQRHIGPLLGRLGCNGRACHGSFQGRGGFQLSLFGYDFHADHKALLNEGSGRVDTDAAAESLILAKPTDADMHEGGKRMELGSWQYRVLKRWIEAGAEFSGKLQTLQKLEVSPAEIIFEGSQDQTQLHVVAHWADGSAEDVTELCRFTTNDDSVAVVAEDGTIKSMGAGDTHVVIAYDKAVVPVAVMRPVDVKLASASNGKRWNQPIDQLVQKKLDKLRITPSERCNDSDFIRRASLDATGLVPSHDRVTAFLADQSPDKREKLIDELLESSAYAAWWATRMSDWTGNNEAQLNNYFPARGAASLFWFAWLQKRMAENMPYDKIVEGLVKSESRLPGESYVEYCSTMSEACRTGDSEAFASRPGIPQFWARNNFREPEQRAVGFAYTFLGIRIQCAQCHKHPFDQWSKQDFEKFSVLFTPIQARSNLVQRDARDDRTEMMAEITSGKELTGGELRKKVAEALQDGEVVPFPELLVQANAAGKNNKKDKKNKKVAMSSPPTGAVLGDDDAVSLSSDPRQTLMDWLREESNPYFAKALVNRVWANYFGVGIVNPTDDMNLGNPPSNAPLLDHLAAEFVRSGYDLKSLHRAILLSETYQRSSEPNVTNAADYRNFSRHVPHRLPAESVRDAVFFATAGDAEAQKARTNLSTLAIGGGGAYSRQNNREFALQVFGSSVRESNCDCDRSDMPNVLQAIYLQNDSDIHRRLTHSNGWIAQAALKLTGVPLKERAVNTGGDNKDGKDKKKQNVAALKASLAKRVKNFAALPAKRQDMQRAQVEQEIGKISERLERFGEAKVTLDSLLADKNITESRVETVSSVPGNVDPVVKQQAFHQWIKEAYLRTLSRLPDEEEVSTAYAFLDESPNAGEGLESLMWTLLNTKEFILSH